MGISKGNESLVTQTWLKEFLDYNSDTGVFVWIRKPNRRVNIGDRAGGVHSSGYRILTANGIPCAEHRLVCLSYYCVLF